MRTIAGLSVRCESHAPALANGCNLLTSGQLRAAQYGRGGRLRQRLEAGYGLQRLLLLRLLACKTAPGIRHHMARRTVHLLASCKWLVTSQ
jgi:hypothetical protein